MINYISAVVQINFWRVDQINSCSNHIVKVKVFHCFVPISAQCSVISQEGEEEVLTCNDGGSDVV